jgi:hypothetical protein
MNKKIFRDYCKERKLKFNNKQKNLLDAYFDMDKAEGKTFMIRTLENYEREMGM